MFFFLKNTVIEIFKKVLIWCLKSIGLSLKKFKLTKNNNKLKENN